MRRRYYNGRWTPRSLLGAVIGTVPIALLFGLSHNYGWNPSVALFVAVVLALVVWSVVAGLTAPPPRRLPPAPIEPSPPISPLPDDDGPDTIMKYSNRR